MSLGKLGGQKVPKEELYHVSMSKGHGAKDHGGPKGLLSLNVNQHSQPILLPRQMSRQMSK